MLEYDRIDVSEGIHVNKTNTLKECDICHYTGFKYESYLCSVCHSFMQKAINFNDVAIVSIKGSDHRIHFCYMSKDDAINTINNFNINETWACCNFFYYV